MTTAHTLNDIDAMIMQLTRIKAMFGAIIYMMNPEGVPRGCQAEDMENWLADARDRLEQVICMMAKT